MVKTFQNQKISGKMTNKRMLIEKANRFGKPSKIFRVYNNCKRNLGSDGERGSG